MPRFWNINHSTVVVQDGETTQVPVQPSEFHDFTDKEAESIGVEWSNEDPRRGLPEEREFKRRRDAKSEASSDPAESGEENEEKPE